MLLKHFWIYQGPRYTYIADELIRSVSWWCNLWSRWLEVWSWQLAAACGSLPFLFRSWGLEAQISLQPPGFKEQSGCSSSALGHSTRIHKIWKRPDAVQTRSALRQKIRPRSPFRTVEPLRQEIRRQISKLKNTKRFNTKQFISTAEFGELSKRAD